MLVKVELEINDRPVGRGFTMAAMMACIFDVDIACTSLGVEGVSPTLVSVQHWKGQRFHVFDANGDEVRGRVSEEVCMAAAREAALEQMDRLESEAIQMAEEAAADDFWLLDEQAHAWAERRADGLACR